MNKIRLFSSLSNNPLDWKKNPKREIIKAKSPPIGIGRKQRKSPTIRYLSWEIKKDLTERKKFPIRFSNGLLSFNYYLFFFSSDTYTLTNFVKQTWKNIFGQNIIKSYF
jgi:hypothetical protein